MRTSDHQNDKISRGLAVTVAFLCGVLALAITVACVGLALLMAKKPIEDPVIPAVGFSILIPVALIFGVVAVRGFDRKADRLLNDPGWRLVMIAILAVGLALTIVFHPIALFVPTILSILLYLMIDPSADWLRSLFAGL